MVTQHRKPHYAENHAATAQPLDRSLDILTAQHSTHVALGAISPGSDETTDTHKIEGVAAFIDIHRLANTAANPRCNSCVQYAANTLLTYMLWFCA